MNCTSCNMQMDEEGQYWYCPNCDLAFESYEIKGKVKLRIVNL